MRSLSAQLTKLNSELLSAFSQVTGEMGELKASEAAASSTLSALTNQDMVARLRHPPAAEAPLILPPARPAAPAPTIPQEVPLDPRWELGLTTPRFYSGEFDKCRGFLRQRKLLFLHQPSRFRSDGAKVALIISALSDWALDWAMAALGSNPQLANDLRLFSDEFKKTFDHPSCGADAAGRLHSLSQGSRSVAEYTLEFLTLAADAALRSAYRRGLSEITKDLIV